MSQLISASAAILPWLPSMHTGTACPESPEAEADGHSSEQELVVGALDTTTSATALELAADLEVGMGMAPVHSSTPMPSQPSWAEVVHRRRRDLVKGRVSPPPPFTLSNCFISLMDEAPVHLDDAPAVPLASEPADSTLALVPPITAASPSPVGSAEWAARCSTIGTRHRRMLQEAIIRSSGDLPRAEPPRSCPPAQTIVPEQLSSSQMERPLPSPGHRVAVAILA
eukprot:superscaffoldBa00003135_g16198